MSNKTFSETRNALPGFYTGKTYTQTEVSGALPNCKDWRHLAFSDFGRRLASDDFPCLFAKKAWQDSSIIFLFCQQQCADEYNEFLGGLLEYTNFVSKTPVDERLFSPLVVFFDDYFYGDAAQHRVGWDALNWVHQRDPFPWPGDISTNPDDENWCYCFNGIHLFVNISARDHKKLKSRNLGKYLTLVINPRKNFDIVASISTRSGRRVREKIRSRIADYNDGVVPIELGFYGEQGNLEWHQYQLSEDGLERPSRCPFLFS